MLIIDLGHGDVYAVNRREIQEKACVKTQERIRFCQNLKEHFLKRFR